MTKRCGCILIFKSFKELPMRLKYHGLLLRPLCLLIFLTNGWATIPVDGVRSVHYGLAVGQGQCSTTISTISSGRSSFKVAVTADIGTSSFRTDPKFSSGYDYEKLTLVLRRKEETRSAQEVVAKHDRSLTSHPVAKGSRVRTLSERSRESHIDPLKRPDEKISAAPPRKLTAMQQSHIGSGRSGSLFSALRRGASISGDDKETLKDSFKFLTDQLKEVLCWFVFLSHPDKDHINQLSSTFLAIQESAQTAGITPPKMFLLAGGEWFNRDSTEEIRQVIDLWRSQPLHIIGLFPFQDAMLSPKELRDRIRQGPEITKDSRSFNPKERVNGYDLEAFHGTLTCCLEKIYPAEYQELERWLEPLFPPTLQALDKASPSQGWSLLKQHILDKIYIWSLDYGTGGTNAQSLVWSHAVDDLGWTFVYTGDAEKKTFEKISSVLDWSQTPSLEGQRHQTGGAAAAASPEEEEGGLESWARKGEAPCPIERWDPRKDGVIKIIQGSDNLVMLHAMHHGAKDNFSKLALRMFPPDACFFSAGNGMSFPHPHTETVQMYAAKTNPSKLWALHELVGRIAYNFIVFDEKGGGAHEGKAWAVPLIPNCPLLLCPNAYGTVIINQDGISVPYMAHHTGYTMYSLLRAYEIDSAKLVNRGELEVKALKSKNKRPTEAYFREAFWKYLKNKALKPNKEDASVYEDDPKAPYKLRMIEAKPSIYFYILKNDDPSSVLDLGSDADADTESRSTSDSDSRSDTDIDTSSSASSEIPPATSAAASTAQRSTRARAAGRGRDAHGGAPRRI